MGGQLSDRSREGRGGGEMCEYFNSLIRSQLNSPPRNDVGFHTKKTRNSLGSSLTGFLHLCLCISGEFFF